MSVNPERLAPCLTAVRSKNPLVHCVTNYVTANDCANALLAVGASPVMADDIAEMEDLVSIADALVINIGTLNERVILSMRSAMAAAARKGVPILLDPVGAGASRLRTETARAFMAEFPLAAIRGNASEIGVLASGTGASRGVDARDADGALASVRENASRLARSCSALVAVTGAVDVVTDGEETRYVRNGHPLLPQITGSGCMLSAVAGAFLGACRNGGGAARLDALTAALCLSGLAGELAATEEGTGTFRVRLIDVLSRLDEATFAGGIRCDAHR